jgi:hypothetical protein
LILVADIAGLAVADWDSVSFGNSRPRAAAPANHRPIAGFRADRFNLRAPQQCGSNERVYGYGLLLLEEF